MMDCDWIYGELIIIIYTTYDYYNTTSNLPRRRHYHHHIACFMPDNLHSCPTSGLVTNHFSRLKYLEVCHHLPSADLSSPKQLGTTATRTHPSLQHKETKPHLDSISCYKSCLNTNRFAGLSNLFPTSPPVGLLSLAYLPSLRSLRHPVYLRFTLPSSHAHLRETSEHSFGASSP